MAMANRVKNTLGAFVLVAVSAALAFLLCEGIVRIFPALLSESTQLRLHWAAQSGGSPPSPHPYIGFVPRPAGFAEGADASGASAEAIWGHRNRAPWPASAEIVAVGDSLTYSQMAELDQAWTVLLDDELPNVRVLTLGIIGTAPRQYLRVFETYGQALSPKLVLVGLFMGNDIADERVFDRWWREAREQDFRYFRSGESERGPRAWLRQLSKRSYLAAMLRELRTIRSKDRFLAGETIELASGERVQIVPRFLVNSLKDAVAGDPAFDQIIKSLTKIDALAAEWGSACLVLLLPSKEEVYGQFASRVLPDLSAPVVAELERRGIDYFDLGPAFRERARDGQALFLEVDGHPTPRGYALIAEAVREFLTQNAAKYGLDVGRAPIAEATHPGSQHPDGPAN